MNDEPDQPWKELVKAAHKARAESPDDASPTPPPNFVSRMREMRQSLWQIARTILWRRWSLIAIVIALLLYLVAYFLLRTDPAPTIPPPEPPDPLTR